MKLLVLVLLAGCAVKCDDSNYYIVEMTDDLRSSAKPLQVYWNVPTMQCKSKKIPFQNLYEKYGIIQNDADSFRGDKVAILYDPGFFPALLKNETSGKYEFRNGGVPQEGNLEKHIESFESVLKQSVPDPDFRGIGIIDFESWRPVFRQNFGVLVPYKDISYEIERSRHPIWPSSWVKEEARQRFESSARKFMETTITIAKRLRPKALWGYYGFPYCFNMASNNLVEKCSYTVSSENDQINWLWSESTALYPSVYSSRSLSTAQLVKLVRGRVAEATRTGRGPVLPYFWFRYREGGYMSQEDLAAFLKTIYKSKATGFIIWGSSSDVNTVDKCTKLLNYVDNILGPAIAKYTKGINRNDDELQSSENNTSNEINYNENATTTTIAPTTEDPFKTNSSEEQIQAKLYTKQSIRTTRAPLKNIEPDLADPEYDWKPPQNYSQEIKRYVEEEYTTTENSHSSDELLIQNLNRTIIDYILDAFIYDDNFSTTDVSTDTTDWHSIGTTESSIDTIDWHSISTTESSIDTKDWHSISTTESSIDTTDWHSISTTESSIDTTESVIGTTESYWPIRFAITTETSTPERQDKLGTSTLDYTSTESTSDFYESTTKTASTLSNKYDYKLEHTTQGSMSEEISSTEPEDEIIADGVTEVYTDFDISGDKKWLERITTEENKLYDIGDTILMNYQTNTNYSHNYSNEGNGDTASDTSRSNQVTVSNVS